jgi:hypothetical protein
MKNIARALVVGGMASAAALGVTGVAMAQGVYPPAQPSTPVTAVTPVTPVTQVLGESITAPVQAAPAQVAAVAVAAPSASLPFTGLDTVALAGAGVVLVGAGAALTIASRKRKAGSTIA